MLEEQTQHHDTNSISQFSTLTHRRSSQCLQVVDQIPPTSQPILLEATHRTHTQCRINRFCLLFQQFKLVLSAYVCDAVLCSHHSGFVFHHIVCVCLRALFRSARRLARSLIRLSRARISVHVRKSAKFCATFFLNSSSPTHKNGGTTLATTIRRRSLHQSPSSKKLSERVLSLFPLASCIVFGVEKLL